MSQNAIVPVLSEIQAATGSTASEAAWVVTGFFVSSAVLTVIAGRLGDLFGRKPVLLVSLGLFAAGGVIAAAGGSLGAVVVGRVIMGVAGGVFPLSFAILGRLLPRDRAAFGMGMVSSMLGLGGALGLPVGGLVADHFGYQGLFWGAAGMAAVALAAIALLVPGVPDRGTGRVDWVGALLLTLALSTSLLAVSRGEAWGWLSAPVLALFGSGVVGLAVLVAFERRVRDPLVNLDLMRRRNVWLAHALGFLVTCGQITAFLLVPQMVRLPAGGGAGLDAGATQAGLYLLPFSLTTLVAGALTGRAVARFGTRPPLAVGAASAVVGLAVLGFCPVGPVTVLVGAGATGIGGGTVYSVLPVLIAEAVPENEAGATNGINTIIRNIAMAIVSQVSAVVLVLWTPAGEEHPVRVAFTIDYGMSALLNLLALCLVPLVLPRQGVGGRRGRGPLPRGADRAHGRVPERGRKERPTGARPEAERPDDRRACS
ncbi:MFS transporter [Thermobifida halotolerans]|uniref:MFS transporter n=2 Tax=Thermobifida halotolerans TaxID=483545 RepID=A0AA97M1B3_9ACTN|nr:MFS transporter [Thermobifida halotolerans]